VPSERCAGLGCLRVPGDPPVVSDGRRERGVDSLLRRRGLDLRRRREEKAYPVPGGKPPPTRNETPFLVTRGTGPGRGKRGGGGKRGFAACGDRPPLSSTKGQVFFTPAGHEEEGEEREKAGVLRGSSSARRDLYLSGVHGDRVLLVSGRVEGREKGGRGGGGGTACMTWRLSCRPAMRGGRQRVLPAPCGGERRKKKKKGRRRGLGAQLYLFAS